MNKNTPNPTEALWSLTILTGISTLFSLIGVLLGTVLLSATAEAAILGLLSGWIISLVLLYGVVALADKISDN